MARESIIQVFYGGTATTAPGDLYDGEFAFANGSGSNKKLFIGSGGNNTANWIGAIIEDQSTINWSSVTSENNKIPTQYAVKSLSSSYLPLAGGSMTGDITLGTAAEINFTATGGGGGTIKIQAPSATTGNSAYTFTLPVNDGSANEVLTTDGNGALSWTSAGTATNVSVSNDDTSTTAYVTFTTVTSGNTGILVDSDGLTYNAATDTLTLAGDIQVEGGDIRTAAGTATVFNTSATTLNIGGQATAITMGDSTTATTTIRGGTLVGNTATQNLFNTTATTLNLGGAATAITMGDSTTATTTIRGGTLVGNTTTQNLFNTTATTLNLGGAATTVSIGSASGTTTINNENTVVTGDLAVNGGDITSSATTSRVLNQTVTDLGIGGAATTVTIGATSGTANIRNATLNLGNTTASITTNSGGGTATTNHLTVAPYGEVRIQPTAGTGVGGTRPSIVVQNSDTGSGQVQITGGDLYLGRESADLSTYTGSTIIFEGDTAAGGFTTTLKVADPTGSSKTITLPNNNGTVALTADKLSVFAATTSAELAGVISDETGTGLLVFGTSPQFTTSLTTGSSTFALLNTTATTVNFAGAATALTMGDATTATTTIRGGTLVGNTTTQNLFNTTATTLNIGGAATAITMGDSTSATTTIRGGTLVGNTTTQNLFNTTATTLNIGGAATAVNVGSSSGITSFGSGSVVINASTRTIAPQGDNQTLTISAPGTDDPSSIKVEGNGNITLDSATSIFVFTGISNAATSVTLEMPATATIGDSATGDTTLNLATAATGSGNTKVVNVGTGAAVGSTTNVNIGSANGGTVAIGYNATVGNNLTVTGNLTVSGTTITANVDTVSIEDPLLFLANNNTSSDAVDIGFYGVYDTSGSQDLYCGFFRDATDNKFKLYVGSQSAPSGAVISTSATGYATATLVANISGGTF
jgi:hypothetical protein